MNSPRKHGKRAGSAGDKRAGEEFETLASRSKTGSTHGSNRCKCSVFQRLRLISIIRNPIDRAWSKAKIQLRKHEVPLADASAGYFRKQFRSHGFHNFRYIDRDGME